MKRKYLPGILALLIAALAAYLLAVGWQVSGALAEFAAVDDGVFSRIPRQSADPLAKNYEGNPREALGWPYQSVRMPSELGPLPGWVVPGEGAPTGAWMVYVHGVGGQRENGYRFTSVARPLGITTLLLSYRNDRGAPATADGLYRAGLTEWRDLESGVRFALQQGATSIILAGDSMGGAIVGQFLRRSELAGQVQAAVLDAPALDIPAVAQNFVQAKGLPLATAVTRVGLWLLRQRLGVDYLQARSVDTLARQPALVFNAHGSADPLVPVSTSDALHALRPGMVYLRTGAVHIESWAEDPQRYREALTDFLQQVLQPP